MQNAILVLFLLLAWIFWFWEYQKKTASVGSCYNLRELIETRHFFELLWRRRPLRFPQDRGLRSTSRMSQAVSKRLTRMTRKSSWFPTLLPDIYKVLHCRGYEIGIFFLGGDGKDLIQTFCGDFLRDFPKIMVQCLGCFMMNHHSLLGEANECLIHHAVFWTYVPLNVWCSQTLTKMQTIIGLLHTKDPVFKVIM